MKKTRLSKDNALLVAGIVFGMMALIHLLRVIVHFNLLVARYLVPIWMSYPALLIFLGLTIWMFMARSSKSR